MAGKEREGLYRTHGQGEEGGAVVVRCVYRAQCTNLVHRTVHNSPWIVRGDPVRKIEQTM
jgi:hypothetical protein